MLLIITSNIYENTRLFKFILDVINFIKTLKICYIFLFYRYLALLGLLLIAIGTGGIKPCVSSFGGDQFQLPAQEDYLQKFFSIFYFSINAGSLISTAITPELRKSVQCFGRDTCFPMAFGLPASLMIISICK